VAKTYEIRDPIHHRIDIDEAERQVLDHPWVQRLRHIRQLGFVSLVYPGAVHDRFQHSVGVMFLAGKVFDQLRQSGGALLHDYDQADLDYARRLLRLAGLLHEIGHAPFSPTAAAWFPDIATFVLPYDW